MKWSCDKISNKIDISMYHVRLLFRKKVISKIRWVKVDNFTLNPYILDNFAYITME